MYNILNLPIPQVEETLEDKIARTKTQRFYLLLETDWTQVADVSPAVKNKWGSYRQALRDITAQPGFPHEINWPTLP